MYNRSHTHINELTQQAVRRLALSLIITLAFVFVEIAAGIFSNSLALLTDAAHNFTDVSRTQVRYQQANGQRHLAAVQNTREHIAALAVGAK